MSGQPVPSQLDQVLPRFYVQKAGPYHPFGRIRIAPFGKGGLRILAESGYNQKNRRTPGGLGRCGNRTKTDRFWKRVLVLIAPQGVRKWHRASLVGRQLSASCGCGTRISVGVGAQLCLGERQADRNADDQHHKGQGDHEGDRAARDLRRHVYPVHVMTRKSFGLMTRKLSVTESQRSAQFPGTFSRRKLSVASANWAQVA